MQPVLVSTQSHSTLRRLLAVLHIRRDQVQITAGLKDELGRDGGEGGRAERWPRLPCPSAASACLVQRLDDMTEADEQPSLCTSVMTRTTTSELRRPSLSPHLGTPPRNRRAQTGTGPRSPSRQTSPSHHQQLLQQDTRQDEGEEERTTITSRTSSEPSPLGRRRDDGTTTLTGTSGASGGREGRSWTGSPGRFFSTTLSGTRRLGLSGTRSAPGSTTSPPSSQSSSSVSLMPPECRHSSREPLWRLTRLSYTSWANRAIQQSRQRLFPLHRFVPALPATCRHVSSTRDRVTPSHPSS